MQTKIKSYAKLNLALNITGKNSNLHKIESIVAFASLHDEIFISEIKSQSHNILERDVTRQSGHATSSIRST